MNEKNEHQISQIFEFIRVIVKLETCHILTDLSYQRKKKNLNLLRRISNLLISTLKRCEDGNVIKMHTYAFRK